MADSAAFEILYKEYYPRVFALCRRLLLRHECAEDATQETFTRAYKTFRQYQSDKPFWHWIAAIAHNYCIDRLRLDGRWQEVDMSAEADLDQLASADALTEDVLIAAENQSRLHNAIDRLPEKYRLPFVMAYQVQLSYDDIAVLLELNRSHVGVLLLRAKQQLRAKLTAATKGG